MPNKKNLMKPSLFLILYILAVFTSCNKVSIKSDPENPGLPIYSEKGLNVGGILINNNVWLTIKLSLFSTVHPLELYSYPAGDSIVVLLNGNFKDSGFQNKNLETIFVVIKNIHIIADEDLVQLNG